MSPVIACLVAVYGAESGRGVAAEMDPLLIILPPLGLCFLIKWKANLTSQKDTSQVDRNNLVPVLKRDLIKVSGKRCDSGIIE